MAERLGALRPDNVVVGLTEGFFVSSGPKVLAPAGDAVSGRTLYLPLPYLPLLRPDEVVSIIGHELAHFTGRDTEYSLRFLPIYAGVGRSLDAVAQGGADGRGAGSPLLSPALWLGTFVMEQFHHAVLHWSRRREFAADAAGAGVTSAEAAARALLRSALRRPERYVGRRGASLFFEQASILRDEARTASPRAGQTEPMRHRRACRSASIRWGDRRSARPQ